MPMTQLPIDYDLRTGPERRDAGIAQVIDHNEDWAERARALLLTFVASRREDFTAEDFRLWASAPDPATGRARLEAPHHPNAWSGLANGAARRNWIHPTGEYRMPTDARSHARKIQVYRRGNPQ
jgi:hypothetical protein